MLCGRLPFSQDNQDVNVNHIIEGFYEIPKYISPNCIEVIKACLEINPEKRITFNKLRHLKWVNYKNFEYAKGIDINKENIIVDDIILQECKKYISTNNQDILNKIKKSVTENKFDEFSSLYYLVFQKQTNKGYRSIFDLNKNNILYNYIDIANSNEEIISDKDDLSNNSFHTHTNSYSSFIINKNNKCELFDISNNKNTNSINRKINNRTIKNIKNYTKDITSISSMNIRYKKYIFSPKYKKIDNDNKIIDYNYYHKKILNRLKSSDFKADNQILSTPKIYTKKTSFIAKPKFLNIKSKSNYKIKQKITITNSGIKIKNKESNEKINNNNNKNYNKPLNTLFVNRINNIKNEFYSNQKRKNKSSEGFYLTSKNNNTNYKTKTNLISINKKNLFINISNNDNGCKEKNENNIDKILIDDQPAINFSLNFNNTLLDSNNNKNIQNDKEEEIIMNNKNANTNEGDYFNKKSILKKQKKSIKSNNRSDHFFETPKKIREDSNYFKYNHKYNLKTNHYYKLNSSNKGYNSIIDSFNKFIPTKKLLRPNVLRNSKNEQYYNTTLYQEDKTLNKIRSFGGLKITKQNQNQENNFQKNFCQNTFSVKEKDKLNEFNKYFEPTDKKIINKNENNMFSSKFNKMDDINSENSDVGIIDLTCLKLCIYEDLIEKIRNALKKYKIKYCFINQNKIHCSGKTGLFFDIEIKNLNSKNNNKKAKAMNNNIYSYKNNNKISVKKIENTSFGFKKLNKNKTKNGKKCNVLYYINFISKQIDFRKNNSKLIYDILH